MSIPALDWAITSAQGVPASCVAVLIGLARHADKDGRGSHPNEATLAAYARKSVRQVRRDLRDLETLGLITDGDQSVVAHIRADQRPRVYNLSLDRTSMSAPGRTPTTGRDRTYRVERPDIQGRTTGHGCPPNQKKNQEMNQIKRARDDTNGAANGIDLPAIRRELIRRTGRNITDEWAREVIDHVLHGQADIRNITGYVIAAIRADPNPAVRFLPVPVPPRFQRAAGEPRPDVGVAPVVDLMAGGRLGGVAREVGQVSQESSVHP